MGDEEDSGSSSSRRTWGRVAGRALRGTLGVQLDAIAVLTQTKTDAALMQTQVPWAPRAAVEQTTMHRNPSPASQHPAPQCPALTACCCAAQSPSGFPSRRSPAAGCPCACHQFHPGSGMTCLQCAHTGQAKVLSPCHSSINCDACLVVLSVHTRSTCLILSHGEPPQSLGPTC